MGYMLEEGPEKATVDHITLDVEGAAVPAYHARPDGEALGGVVLLPDIVGLRPLMEEICRRLATHGLAVCAPETFARLLPPDGELGIEARRAVAGRLHDDVVLEDAAEAADHLVAADGVGSVAVLGFCLGGSFALKAAATGRFERAVAFYGMVRMPPQWGGAHLRDPLDTAGAACPTLAIFGEVDALIPPADVDALRHAWEGRPDHKVVVYPGADHAFAHDPDRPVHRPDAAADAWHRCLSFLLD
ncbi:MAG TPA: dienelactone hydrolase family protein [Acidimicrobiia bacterium]|nr:dienelactone hydrolase family protein [Acidimicrobiia bacterium]